MTRPRPARFFGHPAHQYLNNVPIGIWTAALLWDVVGRVTGGVFWQSMTFWLLGAGLAAAVPALLTGLADFLDIHPSNPARILALYHMLVMSAATLAIAGSFVLRGVSSPGADAAAFALLLFAMSAVFFGSWLGYEFLRRQGPLPAGAKLAKTQARPKRLAKTPSVLAGKK